MAHILVSACLLGESTRYDRGHMRCDHPKLEQWLQENRLISFCPEVEGGLPTPRPPAEIISGDGLQVLDAEAKVLDVEGREVTEQYRCGAQKALQVAQENNMRIAILKARSPSCGSKFIYDGTFSITLKPGKGVTAALLEREGIRVFNEEEIEQAAKFLQAIE
ncbi:MAG: hypothetical protein A2Z14_06065 [Chloroflexi bacterium RBG_16_48_8]|nr:MAG: hypothetical protein A2Z14_06065 [Chloroflexi bacterium RBG_16_48_8]